MKRSIALSLFVISCVLASGQTDKLNIALVSHMDTTFTAFYGSKSRSLNIDLSEHWMQGLLSCMDTSVTEISWERLPEELMSVRDYTNGFFKASKKLQPFLKGLGKRGYDLVIMLCKANLYGANIYGKINWHSYGMGLKKDWAFSLNRIIVYDPSKAKILAEPHQNYYTYEYVADIPGPKIEKSLEELEEADVMRAIGSIKRMDKKTIEAICLKLAVYELRKKYNNSKVAQGE